MRWGHKQQWGILQINHKAESFYLAMEDLMGGVILILAFFYLLGIPSPSKEDVEKMESKYPSLVFWQWMIILFGSFIFGLWIASEH